MSISAESHPPLGSLIRLAVRSAAFDALAHAIAAPVIVLHARAHHVPLNFALAAAVRHPFEPQGYDGLPVSPSAWP